MALRSFVVILAISCTQAVNQYQNEYSSFQSSEGFSQEQFPKITMPPIKPIVFPTFPTFPTFPPQNVYQQSEPGSNFNGVSISSSSFTNVDQNGKVRRGGGTKVITNRNGVIEEHSYPEGDSNINIVSSFPRPSIPKLPSLQLPQIKLPLALPVPFFPKIKVPFLPLPNLPPLRTIDPVTIPKYKPGHNEDFRGRSVVSYRHESNINGERSAGGVDTIINNNNGRVDKKTYKYGDLNDEY